ncbi:MAG TPA: hypothetical protein VFP96_10535 [Candidatus Acidoferrum sp.]|nr:hypothetical protein [Candidatus Acidoferrum sp.]
MNGKLQRVRVKRTGQHGVVVSHDGGRYEVQFVDGQIPYRIWFSAEDLEFLETPSASETNESFGKHFREKMDEASSGMTSGSEQQKVRRVPKKTLMESWLGEKSDLLCPSVPNEGVFVESGGSRTTQIQ